MSSKWVRVAVTTTGTTGSATGTGTTSAYSGLLLGVKLDYHASAPNTTDVTLSEAGGGSRTLLTVSNNNTSGAYYPTVEAQDTAGAAVSGVRLPIALGGTALQVTVAQSNALTDAVVAWLLVVE
jgi:hypothetical protein